MSVSLTASRTEARNLGKTPQRPTARDHQDAPLRRERVGCSYDEGAAVVSDLVNAPRLHLDGCLNGSWEGGPHNAMAVKLEWQFVPRLDFVK